MTINAEKSQFGKSSLEFLGHHVSSTGIKPLQKKVFEINDFPRPSSYRQLRRFLGLVNLYRRFIPNCASIAQPLTNMLRNGPRRFDWTKTADTAFNNLKSALAKTSQLAHYSADPSAKLVLVGDATQEAVGTGLQQVINGETKPLAFISKRLQPAQTRCSTFGRELLAAYLAVKHFCHALEDRQFTLLTDHKPPTYALKTSSDKHSPREIRQLDFLSQFTTDIQYIKGEQNKVADALSRLHLDAISTGSINLEDIARAQLSNQELEDLKQHPTLKFSEFPIFNSPANIVCETSTERQRPFIPHEFRRTVFEKLHGLTHSGVRATAKNISQRFFWPSMQKDVRKWAQTCVQYQRSKMHRHTKTAPGTFQLPEAGFQHIHVDIVGPFPPSNG